MTSEFRPFSPLSEDLPPPRHPQVDWQEKRQPTRFDHAGPIMAARGWAVIPCNIDRSPARVGHHHYDETTPRKALEWRQWIGADHGPTLDEVEAWAPLAPGANTAIILGRPSGGAFAFDLDVNDAMATLRIREIIVSIAGATPFVRVRPGSSHAAMIYRADDDDLPRRTGFVLRGADGSPSSSKVEILKSGQHVMAYGYRHGGYCRSYEWLPTPRANGFHEVTQPTTAGPGRAPSVTGEKIQAILDAIDAEFGIVGHGEPSLPRLVVSNGPTGDYPIITRPSVVLDNIGRAVDGREGFLFDLVRSIVRTRHDLATSEEGLLELQSIVYDEFVRRAVTHVTTPSGKYESDEDILKDIRDKVVRVAREVASGRIPPIQNGRAYGTRSGAVGRPDRKVVLAPRRRKPPKWSEAFQSAGAFAWLGLPRAGSGITMTQPDTARAATRSFPATVSETSNRVGNETKAAIERAVMDLLSWSPTDEIEPPVSCLRGLPGTGKTTSLVTALASAKRDLDTGPLRVLMLAPAHRNLSQIAADARAAGLIVRVLKGKASLCSNPLVPLLEERGISSGGACRSKVRNDHGDFVQIECTRIHECAAFGQYDDLDQIDLILAPHAFLAMTIEKRLADVVQAVVVDESFHGVVLQSVTMPFAELRRVRAHPKPKTAEIRAGIDDAMLHSRRVEACRIAHYALIDGLDVATVIADRADGDELVAAAIATTSRGDTQSARVNPRSTELSLAGILEADDMHGREETRFWKIVDERRRWIVASRSAPSFVVPSHETRIRLSRETIHLAWRDDLNFRQVPWLLLDGSADTAINERILETKIKTMHVTAPLRQHVALVRHTGVSQTRLRAAVAERDAGRRSDLLDELAGIVENVSQQHIGEILVVIRGVAEAALKSMREWPDRIHFGHHNGLKGLNDFKNVEAVVMIGSVFPSPDQLDLLAAALAYDDADPERSLVGRDGKPVWTRETVTVPMRDGGDASFEAPSTVGEWHKRMLSQTRDEDLVQCIARSRQVHRQEPVSVYIVGDYVPVGTIVDLVTTPERVLAATPRPVGEAVAAPRQTRMKPGIRAVA